MSTNLGAETLILRPSRADLSAVRFCSSLRRWVPVSNRRSWSWTKFDANFGLSLGATKEILRDRVHRPRGSPATHPLLVKDNSLGGPLGLSYSPDRVSTGQHSTEPLCACVKPPKLRTLNFFYDSRSLPCNAFCVHIFCISVDIVLYVFACSLPCFAPHTLLSLGSSPALLG